MMVVMAELIRVEDPADPRLDDYRGLRDTSLRKSLESTYGLFIAEGEKVVRRSIEAGFEARSFLMAERWLEGLAGALSQAGDVPCYVVTEADAEAITGFHVHRGALASLRRRPLPRVADVLRPASRVVVLEDVVDHANVGAILRSAAALGADAALLSPRCADPLYRRAIKVSMGAVFSLPWTRVVAWHDAMDMLREAGFTTVALSLDDEAVDISTVSASARSALVVGSEGPGLSARWQQSAQLRARIPMAVGIDSLNVAAAAAVAAYALWSTPPGLEQNVTERLHTGA